MNEYEEIARGYTWEREYLAQKERDLTTPFVWDRDYKNLEQVRLYLADYLLILNEDDTFKYNDDFKGRIPGLAESANEDTGIYLVRNLADVEALKARTQAFISAGGYALSERTPNESERGTLVHTGFYSNGTGWSEFHIVKFKVDSGRVLFKQPRQKNWRTHHAGTSAYLFMAELSA